MSTEGERPAANPGSTAAKAVLDPEKPVATNRFRIDGQTFGAVEAFT